MSDSFFTVNLDDLIEELGEDRTKTILSEFSCPKNLDVETFLKQKAIIFSYQSIAKTHLVFLNQDNKLILVGYYALAMKPLSVQLSRNKRLSKGLQKKIRKFMRYDPDSGYHTMSAVLIGQIGKNYTSGANLLIDGEELLRMALNSVLEVQKIAGGKVVHLECEDKQALKDFYSNNGFVYFDKRPLDRDEGGKPGEYLLRYLRYM